MKESWPIFDDAPAVARPLWLVGERERGPWLEQQDAATTAWLQSARFRAERHQYVALPAADGTVRGAVLGLGGATSTEGLEPWWLAGAADRLPPGTWRIANDLDPAAATAAALAGATARTASSATARRIVRCPSRRNSRRHSMRTWSTCGTRWPRSPWRATS